MKTALPPGRLRKGWRRSTSLHVALPGTWGDSSLGAALDQPRLAATAAGAVRRYGRIKAGLVLTDVMSIAVSLVIAHVLVLRSQPGPFPLPLQLTILPLAWIPIFHAFALYRKPCHPRAEELLRVAGAVSLGVVGGIVVSFWTRQDVSRAWIALFWLLAIVFEIGTRQAWRSWITRLTGDARLALDTLIIGENDEALRTVDALRDGRFGYRPVGCLSPAEAIGSPNGLPMLESLGNLGQVIRDRGVECLFVASSAMQPAEVLSIAHVARREGTEMVVSANLPQVFTSRLSVQPVGDLMTISIRPIRLTGMQAALKRTIDVVFGSVLLVLTLPLWALIGLAIRLTSKGPVFFRQKRVTQGDRVFEMYKFRTMVSNADDPQHQYLDLTVPFFKLPEDPRLTRVGRFLRGASLDELPQLLNVLRGDMSLVGPRPLPAEQVAANQARLSPRHEVRAGITGWWQVNGRSNVRAEDAVSLDLFYIENWSLWLDLYILLKTVRVVLTARGAY